MAIKPRAKGIPPVTAYQALYDFALFVVVSMTANINFTTPDPALASITAAATNLAAAIATWGVTGARGSHVALMDLREKALIVRNLLVQELGYVQTTVVATGGTYAAQAAAITTSGFGVKNAGNPQLVLGMPENFHQQFLNRINIFFVGLRWKKPLNLTSAGNVKNYQIWRSEVNDFFDPSTKVIGTSTKTSFVDQSVAANRNLTYYYWVTASNAYGIGVPAGSVHVAPVI